MLRISTCIVLIAWLSACSMKSKDATDGGPTGSCSCCNVNAPPTPEIPAYTPIEQRCIADGISDATSVAAAADGTCAPGFIAQYQSANSTSHVRCYDSTKAPPVPQNGVCPSGYTVSSYLGAHVTTSDSGFRCVNPGSFYTQPTQLFNSGGFCMPNNDGSCPAGFVKVASTDAPFAAGCVVQYLCTL